MQYYYNYKDYMTFEFFENTSLFNMNVNGYFEIRQFLKM